MAVALAVLLVAGAAVLYSSDWVQEWRLQRMSAEALEEAARERSWDPLLLYHLGLVWARGGDHARAAAAFERAALADPSASRSHRMLGRELIALKRLPEAEAALRRALAVNPEDREAALDLGELFRRVGALKEAIALYEDLSGREREDPEVMYRLAECYGAAHQPDRRLALLERVAQRALDVPRYQLALGSARLYYGRLEEAEKAFRRALQRSPNDPQILYLWGRALAEHGDDATLSAAERMLERAALLRPSHADTHLALGQVGLRRADLERARVHLERATGLDGFEDRALLLLGQTYLRLGRAADGRRILALYRRTTDLGRGIVQLENRLHNSPGDTRARRRLARLYQADGQPDRAAYHLGLLRRAGR